MLRAQAVIDTNPLISAALSSQCAPSNLVQSALAQHRLVFSQFTFEALRTRLDRPKFDRYVGLENRERLLHDFNACAIWVDVAEPAVYCSDRDDDHFIETALKAQAHCLVSGDKDLMEAPEVLGLRILSVHQALDLLAS